MMRYIPLNKKAFALSITLWIVAALLFAIATLATLSKDSFYLTKGLNDKLKTQLIAEDVLESLKFYVLTANFDSASFKTAIFDDFKYKFPHQIVADNRWYIIDENISLRVQDTSNMLNVMKTSPVTIANLATNSEQRQLRYVIEDSINDWKDKDNIVSLNGAESSKYELQANLKYKIRNSVAIQNEEELRLINGISAIEEQKWKILKTKLYYGEGNIANLALVDANYLGFLLNINESQANALIQTRKTNMAKFIKLAYQSKEFNEEHMAFVLSKQLKIEIRVNAQNATSIILTLIDFQLKRNHVYSIIKYKIK